MAHQFDPVKFNGTRRINATEKEELDNRLGSLDKLGFLGTVAPSEATSIKVSTFMRNSKLYGLGLLLDGKPHSWTDPYLRSKFKRHTAEIYTPGMDVTYKVDEKIQRVTKMQGMPAHWHMPRVKMEGSYLNSFKVCYPNSIQARSEWLEYQQTRDEVDPLVLEELFSVLLPVEPSKH
jgi:hypothetical protein